MSAQSDYKAAAAALEKFCNEETNFAVEILTENYPLSVKFTPNAQMSLFDSENYTVDNSRLDTVEYSISFTHAKDIKVYTTAELNIQDTTQVPQTTNDRAASSEAASETPQKTTYTVKPGDNLWAISKKLLGSGSRYTELYEANKSIIGSNPNLIYPGQTFTIPA